VKRPHGLVVKPTKTNRDRRGAIDATTIDELRQLRTAQQKRASVCGVTVGEDRDVFARDERAEISATASPCM
jgi:hypothetical protein